MTVDLNNESGLPADGPGLVRLATFALDQLRIHPLAELSVVLVDENTMSAYHQKYMGEPGPTDVLSFPMDELRPGRDVTAVAQVEVDELVAEAQTDGHEDAHIPGPVSVFRVKAELVGHGYHPANGNSSRGSTRVK